MTLNKRNFCRSTHSVQMRDSYRILPFQGVWTWLTGKEIDGRPQLWQSHSVEMICWSLSWMIVGSIMTSLAWFGSLSLLVKSVIYMTGILFAASGARYIVATIIHHGVHGHLFNSQQDPV